MSKNIKVIDSRMGNGKTEYMIRHMKDNKDKRFIFVTPYLTEVDRVVKSCEFIPPISKRDGGKHKSKLEHFKELVENGLSIVTTHQLFKSLDVESIKLLREWDYTLVLDEVLEVISVSKLSKNEFSALEKLNLIKRENNLWVKGDDEELLLGYSSDWKYSEIVKNLVRNSVEIFEDRVLVWLFPVDLLESFQITYILTYMFDGYPLRPYLELYNFNIEKSSIKDYKLVDYYKDSTSDIKPLINIIEGKLNDIGDGHSAFTIYWFETHVKNNTDMVIDIRKGLNNFYNNKIQCDMGDKKQSTILWTTFKDYMDIISVKGISDKNFLSHNVRATNDYADTYNLAYLANRNYNPIIKKWLIDKKLNTNDDSFALSEMIQWIFRSRIRKGESINVYIPSERMRNLLKAWLA